MTNTLKSLEKWFCGESSAIPLIAAKVGLGVLMMVAYLWELPHVRSIFTEDTIFSTRTDYWFFQPNVIVSYLVYCTVILSGALFAYFWRVRWLGLILTLSHLYMVNAYKILFYGWAMLITFPLLYLSVIEIRRTRDTWVASSWAKRLIQLQITGIYFYATTNRIGNPLWTGGDQVFYFLKCNLSRIQGVNLAALAPILPWLTYIVWIGEFVLAITIWFPRYRMASAIGLILLHSGMEVFGLIGWWSYLMALLLGCFFILESDSAKRLIPYRWRSPVP